MVITIRILGWEILALTLGNDDQADEPDTTTRTIGFAAAELAEHAPVGWIPDEHYR